MKKITQQICDHQTASLASVETENPVSEALKYAADDQSLLLSLLRPDGTIDMRIVREVNERANMEKMLSQFTFPDKPSSDGYYHIYIPDAARPGGRRALKARTIEGLRKKVYESRGIMRKGGDKTFKEVFELSQEEKLKYVKSEERKLSITNTIRRNEGEYRRYFNGTLFEEMPIESIVREDVEDIVLFNLRRYDMKKKSLDSLRAILRAAFKVAYERYWILDNPYSRVDFKKFQDMLVDPVPVSERVYSKKQVQRFLDYIHEKQERRPKYLVPYALEMQIIMGMRRGEIPPLMWADVTDDYISITKEQITVKKTKDHPEYFAVVHHTKNHRDRRYPITRELGEFLGRLREVHQKYYPDSRYLFPADSKNGVITNNAVYNFYRRMLRNLGIKVDPKIIKGTHSFRRNAITDFINSSEGNIIMAAELFGNTPEVARKNYYTGIDLRRAKAILDA